MPILTAAMLLFFQMVGQAPRVAAPKPEDKPLDRSAYFAFVDRQFVFTVEIVKPGVPIFNFVSLADEDFNLLAKQVRLTVENRKVPGTFFLVDTGDPKEPIIVPSVRMRRKSSFGVTLRGDFGGLKEVLGVTITVGEEDFRLVPLGGFAFENLVLKVNRLNLGSPDLSDDWRVLKLENLGARAPIVRRRTANEE
jgi:hypothetical protein